MGISLCSSFFGKEAIMIVNLSNIYDIFLKNGIRKYKYKNSQIKPIGYLPEGKKGAIFGLRSKKSMTEYGMRGIVFTSEEALLENENKLTHWTPNIYSYGAYADKNRSIIVGHSEKNLQQINTFMIDFDLKVGNTCSAQDIIDCSIDLGFVPTLLLNTPGGYQAFYVLESPGLFPMQQITALLELQKMYREVLEITLRKCFLELLILVAITLESHVFREQTM
ncbi:hypothetical protein [Enterococcus rivorum]|uniref:hypothetical protein n=1 Tax=Enterococcus rivorum TaxID=762845 RepID=UPI00362EE89C